MSKFDIREVKRGEIEGVLIVDTSTSMDDPARTNDPNGPNRFKEAEEYWNGLLRLILPLDSDGLTVYTFSNQFRHAENVTTTAKVKELIAEAPRGGTYLGAAMRDWANGYIRKFRNRQVKKHTLVLVLSDGVAHDSSVFEATLKELSQIVDTDERLAVGLLQVGDDSGAKQYMQELNKRIGKSTAKTGGGLFGLFGGQTTEGKGVDIFSVKTIDALEAFDSIEDIINNIFNEDDQAN